MDEKKACGLHCTKINNISVKFGNDVILKNVSIHIHCGELTVIIGRNGAGKSTLLKAILGEVEHKGNIIFTDEKDNLTKKIKIGYVPQKLNIEKHMPTTVFDMFASCISYIPVFMKKDKKIYKEIKEHLKILCQGHHFVILRCDLRYRMSNHLSGYLFHKYLPFGYLLCLPY